MDYNEVIKRAKANIGDKCKVCKECNGLACGNMVPGPGSKAPGNVANDNYNAWKRIKVMPDPIVKKAPIDTSFELFGKKFSMPLMTGPISNLSFQYKENTDLTDYNHETIVACGKAGIIAALADGTGKDILAAGIRDSLENGGCAMPILNPNTNDHVIELIEMVNKADLFCCGVVVDSAGLPHFTITEGNAGAKSVTELAELAKACKAPFVVKGVLSAKVAEKAVEAGADAVIVSNHGGRVLGDVPATAEVLEEVVDAVGSKAKIIVDGGIRTGLDIFKALALGADAALICRPFINAYYGGGAEGEIAYIEKLRKELTDTMYMCGARKLSDITRDMVRVYR